ncbi:MAG TPA: MlaD family protein [Gemmatimonadales bacterium]
MNTQRKDFLVGLFILTAIGIVIGALIVTSGIGKVRYDVFMRAASAEGLTQDTRVLLHGLSVGRVRSVNPVVDSTTRSITFLARLSIQDQFPNGTKLELPAGTRAIISQPTPIAPPVIDLVMPETPTAARLEPGDTVNSERRADVLAALTRIATNLNAELSSMFENTRVLMQRTNATLRQTQSLITTNEPLVQDVLIRLAGNLQRSDSLLADIQPRLAPMHDSISVTLSDARHLIARTDSLVGLAQGIALDNREVIEEMSGLLLRSARILEHFADQVSRRPTRLLFGVRPPPPDSSRDPR